MRLKKSSKPKKISLPKLKKKAWKIFSNWVRITNANADGFLECVTCSTVKHWKQMQAGHFVSGRSGWILFCEDNVHGQCLRCNVFLRGNWPAYHKFMEEKFGIGKIRALIELKNKPMSSTEMLEECNRVISLYGGIDQK